MTALPMVEDGSPGRPHPAFRGMPQDSPEHEGNEGVFKKQRTSAPSSCASCYSPEEFAQAAQIFLALLLLLLHLVAASAALDPSRLIHLPSALHVLRSGAPHPACGPLLHERGHGLVRNHPSSPTLPPLRGEGRNSRGIARIRMLKEQASVYSPSRTPLSLRPKAADICTSE